MSGFRSPLGGIGAAPRASTAPRPATQPAAGPAQARAAEPGTGASFDEEAVRRLEGLKRRHGGLRDLKIRLESDHDRLRRDHEASCADGIAQFGTADVEALDAIAEESRRKVTETLDGFEATLDDIEARLAEASAVA